MGTSPLNGADSRRDRRPAAETRKYSMLSVHATSPCPCVYSVWRPSAKDDKREPLAPLPNSSPTGSLAYSGPVPTLLFRRERGRRTPPQGCGSWPDQRIQLQTPSDLETVAIYRFPEAPPLSMPPGVSRRVLCGHSAGREATVKGHVVLPL